MSIKYLHFSLSFLCLLAGTLCLSLVSITGCELTEPNISYDECLAGKAPCDEVCNGEDDDEDGLIDEALSETCIILSNLSLSPSSFSEGFGRSLFTVPDLNNDGYSELLISTTRASAELDLDSPEVGKVALIDGASREIQWIVEYGGDFGYSLVVGETSDGNYYWCSGAPTREGNDGVFGRILCLDFEGGVIDSFSAQSEFGLGHWLSILPTETSDQVIVSEPLWSGGESLLESVVIEEDRPDAGRVLIFNLEDGELKPQREITGSMADQRIGERVIAVGDGNDDGVDDLLLTGYSSDNSAERQVWLADGSRDGSISRLKRFSASEYTDGTFGASLASGYFDSENDLELLAFGAPFIEGEREGDIDRLSRIYFTTVTGEPLGTNSARILDMEDLGIGESMSVVSVSDSDLLFTAGPGKLRVLRMTGETAEVIQEFDLPRESSTVLSSSGEPDEDGLIKVWIGLPELGLVKLAIVRPVDLDE